MCRLSSLFSRKVIRDEFFRGTREMLLLYFYVGRVPSFREIGKARGEQYGPWTIEGSLMYLVAREDGNSRVNEKWSNGKDKGRQRRWEQKWEARLAGRENGFASTYTYIVPADVSWMMRDEERWTKMIDFSWWLSLFRKNFLFIKILNIFRWNSAEIA